MSEEFRVVLRETDTSGGALGCALEGEKIPDLFDGIIGLRRPIKGGTV